MKNKIFSLALIAIMAIGCNTTKKTGETTGNNNKENLSQELITQEKWTLIKLEGQDIPNRENPVYFTLSPDENNVNGFAGCNTFMGGYTLEEGNRIRFSQIAITRMACPDESIDENEILNVFELADNYTINEDTLSLNVGRRAPLAVFKKAMPQITEKYWKLVTLEGQPVKMDENQEKEAHFMLKTNENRVQGFAGCNNFNGTYTLETGNRIRFSQMLATLRACPEVDANESEFLKVFELADSYTINGDTLSLNVGKREVLAVFEAVYFE